MIRKTLVAILIFTQASWAGLPPTSSKVSGDSSNVTTFNFQFPNLTGTHTGTTVSIPTFPLPSPSPSGYLLQANGTAWVASPAGAYPMPSPSPSSIAMDISNAWAVVPFPSPSPSGYVVTTTGSGFTSQPISAIGISTDWITDAGFTPNNFGTVTQQSIQRRRIGDSMQVMGFFKAGTLAASVASLSLPSGYAIDSTKFTSQTNAQQVGWWMQVYSGTTTTIGAANRGPIFYDGSTTGTLYFAEQFGSNQFTKNNASVLGANTDGFSVEFTVPISGWSSNTIGASQGSVYAQYYLSTNQSSANGVPINFDTKQQDSGCASGTCLVTTGASWKFTATVGGMYDVFVNTHFSSGGSDLFIYKNGTQAVAIATSATGSSPFLSGSQSIYLNPTDYIDIRGDVGTTVNGGLGGGTYTQTAITIGLRSGNGAGNISSNSTSSYHVESVTFGGSCSAEKPSSSCTSGTCSMCLNSGGVNSVSFNSTGTYLLSFTSGTYVKTPVCTCSCNQSPDCTCETGNWSSNGLTAPSLYIHTVSPAGSALNSEPSVICMGQ